MRLSIIALTTTSCRAGELYRLMSEAQKQRLIGNIAASLSQVSREDIIERSVTNFHKADPEYGGRLAEALAKRGISRRAGFEGINPVAAEKRPY